MRSLLKVWFGISFMAIGLGIGIVIIAFATSGFHKAEATTSLHKNYEGVKSIDMDINYREVNVVEGEQFSISAENIVENEIDTSVKDGTWYIKENSKDNVNFFGFHVSVNDLFNWDNSHQITITIPKDFIAKNITVNIKAGSLHIDELKADKCDLNVQSGRLSVEKLAVSNQSKYHVGAGEITIDNIIAKDIDLSCDVGKIHVSGTITGDNSIQNNVGEVKLALDGKESDYSYEVSCNVGNVTVGDINYHKINNKIINDNNAKNNIKLDCRVGKIKVKFN